MCPELWSCEPLRLSGCIADSIVDGPGLRFVVFAQGCPHHCPGCHNPQTHDFFGGKEVSQQRIIALVGEHPLCAGVTFSGGEPFCQPKAFAALGEALKCRGKSIMTYTGYTYEQLKALCSEREGVKELLLVTDILVDGPFVAAKRNLSLCFRGSENQRLLRLREGKLHHIMTEEEIAGMPKISKIS